MAFESLEIMGNSFTITTNHKVALHIEQLFKSKVFTARRTISLGHIDFCPGYAVVEIIKHPDFKMTDIFWLGMNTMGPGNTELKAYYKFNNFECVDDLTAFMNDRIITKQNEQS